MGEGDKPLFGEAEAKRLLDAGWRQAVAFRAPDDLDVPVKFDRVNEWLVVCTQSCSVVSDRLGSDPYIEVAVAKPVKRYKPRAQEATGKHTRRFHLPLAGVDGVEAVECDINRRFFVARELFLTFVPDMGIQVAEAVKAFAGWMSRYYTRVALPNTLVDRAKAPGGLFDSVKAALDHPFEGDAPLADWTAGIYVAWEPDSELDDSHSAYLVRLLIVCDGSIAETMLGELLCNSLARFEAEGGHDGISLQWETKARVATFVTDLDGYHRLSEWDYLTDLGKVGSETDNLGP